MDKIENIQLLRGVAALGVVIFHTGFQLRPGLNTDFQGVAIFFVISGFIMTYVSRKNADNFLVKRCIRIVPLYTLCTLFIFFEQLSNLFPFHIFIFLAADKGAIYSLTIVNLLKSLLFIPYKNHAGNFHPINGVGWTLNLEMYFYLLYSLMLVLNKKYAPLLVSFMILLVNALIPLFCANTVLVFYSHPYTYFFVIGVLLFYTWNISPTFCLNRIAVVLYSIVVAVLFITCQMLPELNQIVPLFVMKIVSFIFPLLLVAGALALHSMDVTTRCKPILHLGNASYALYLVHAFVIDKMRMHGFDTKYNLLNFLLLIILCSFMALFLHFKIERPMSAYLKMKLLH